MRYDTIQDFKRNLKENATSNGLHVPYLIIAKEELQLKESVDLLLKFLIPKTEERALALSSFDGSQINEAFFWESASSRSFLAPFSVIVIQQAEKLKKGFLEKLEIHFSKPSSSSTILIFSAQTWPKKSEFLQLIEKRGIVLDLPELKPWEKEKQLVEWLNNRFIKEKKKIPQSLCQKIVKLSGANGLLIANEFEKLMCYCAEKTEISQEDVQAVSIFPSTDTIWQFGEALFSRDSFSAIKIARQLLADGLALLPFLRQIRSQYQVRYQIGLLLTKRKGEHEITSEFPYLKGQILERHIQQTKNYGIESYRRGILLLDQMELKIKNSNVDESTLIELLIYQLTRQQ